MSEAPSAPAPPPINFLERVQQTIAEMWNRQAAQIPELHGLLVLPLWIQPLIRSELTHAILLTHTGQGMQNPTTLLLSLQQLQRTIQLLTQEMQNLLMKGEQAAVTMDQAIMQQRMMLENLESQIKARREELTRLSPQEAPLASDDQ